MAIITPITSTPKKNTRSIVWVGSTGDTFKPFVIRGPVPLNITVQSEGGTTMSGSMFIDNSVVDSLKDEEGIAISLSDGGISEIRDRPATIYPIPTGVAMTVKLLISY